MGQRIGIIIVDDSAATRQILARELGREADIDVLGVADSPYTARELIIEKRPQVVTLDLDMPRMDGLTFLRRVMKFLPTPVIVCSSLTPTGCAKSIECLDAGAFDVIGKPAGSAAAAEFVQRLAELVRAAARANRPVAPVAAPTALVARRSAAPATIDQRSIIVIGSSTGGTEALRAVLTALPAQMPPIAIVQHMPEGFTKLFAGRLNGLCELEVREAREGEPFAPGVALLAPGGKHLRLRRDATGRYVANVADGPQVKHHRPSVEILFESTAAVAGKHAIGVLLTGMGDDGADGLLSIRRAGGATIAQDEASCVVFGMPKAAIDRGAADVVLPLGQIADRLRTLASANDRKVA
ncbi:MAG: chemotaxis response regulator protein-glutamate methylesterase [Phycisphaerales bacterium]